MKGVLLNLLAVYTLKRIKVLKCSDQITFKSDLIFKISI